jgi:hypothetical protein
MAALYVIWIGAAAYLNCLGWLLATLGQLNSAGYALGLLPGILLAGPWFLKSFKLISLGKISRRFRRPLPAVFLLVVGLVFLGGILYAPSNFDALTYRLPRMLNWLSAGKWFWIATINQRQNYSGVAWEWLALPLFTLLRSDRTLFLINAFGFCLLPGLIFAVFRQLGVARKVAWIWMWLLPLAYGYVTQAGSIGNDLLGALFCLLSVHFGLRACRSEKVADIWLAVLAAALLTGTKLSNLPLALPCVVAVWPALRCLKKNVVGTLAVGVLAGIVSALPIMALNQLHAGSWNGDPHNEYKMQIRNPVAGVLGNGFLVAEQAVVPPVLPAANQIHTKLTGSLPGWLKDDFPRLFSAKINELPAEEGAGLGLTTMLPLLLAGVLALVRFRPVTLSFNLFPPVVLAACFAFMVYLAKMGSEAGPRLLLPYYPLVLVPLLRLRSQADLLGHRWGRIFLVLTAWAVLPVLVLSVARPLWPAQSVTAKLAAAHPHSAAIQRFATACAAYANRNDVLAPLRAAIPNDTPEIGFIAGSNDSSYSLWRPFGQRRVTDLRPQINAFLLQPETSGFTYVVVKAENWSEICPQPLESWAVAHRTRIVLSPSIVQLVSAGPQMWYVLEIPAAR